MFVAGHRVQAGHGHRLAPVTVLLVDQERRVVAAEVVLPAGRAVACRGARHRGHLREPAAAQRAGDRTGGSPGPVRLADHECLIVARGLAVLAAGRAVACRGARHRGNLRVPASVQVCRDFLGGAPAAVPLADGKCLRAAGGVSGIKPASGAAARRGARYRLEAGVRALLQGRQAWYLDGLTPDAALLGGHKAVLMAAAVGVEPDGRAGAPRRARYRDDLGVPALVQGRQARHLDRLAPATVARIDHEPLMMAASTPIEPAGRAGARRSARHLDGLAPAAVGFAVHEPTPAAVMVVTPSPAVARGGTRHRQDDSLPALV